MIESYSFGEIKINGKTYNNDVKIFSERVKSNWWRKEGHRLHLEDIEDIIEESPEVLIVGTGSSNRMTVPSETREGIESNGINLIVKDTKKACETYNEISEEEDVVAALHLTC